MAHTSVWVVGGGVVGCATAYLLARAGHRVSLLEALDGPAQVTSFANGAQLSYSYVEPLATPGTLSKVPSMLLDPESPLRLRLTGECTQISWGLRFMQACRQSQVDHATRALLGLSFLSRDELEAATAEEGLEYDYARPGKLVVYPDAASLDGARRQVMFQARHGCEQAVIDTEACLAREPALSAYRDHVAGGVWTPGEAVGDAARLSEALLEAARRHGAEARFNARVSGLRRVAGRVVALVLKGGEEVATPGTVVLAPGNDAAAVGGLIGLRLPIYPIKGYSVTLPIIDPAKAPRVSVTDLRRKTVYAPLRDSLRVAGFAELVGPDRRIEHDKIRRLIAATEDTFPGACHLEGDPAAWAGQRPSTPTSMPIVGATPVGNVLINVGHGSLGLTLAMGSARLIERILAGQPDPIGEPFTYVRQAR